MASKHTINISVLADTKKFSNAMRNLSRETGLSRLGGAFKNAGARIVSFFKTGIKWAGAFAAAMLGLAIKGGFERLLAIEDAEAKLKGLGHTTQAIDAIMGDALASVRGTAFGLDEAGTAAANAVASGVQPGKDLERQLSLIGDAATIAGVDFGSMGSVFSKVTAANRLSMQEVNSLMDQGIPILQWLSEEYGTTADEMRNMVSRGEIDADAFRAAVEDNIGGAALEAGNTTRGSFANMRAALSRFGVAILEDVFPMFREAFSGITEWLDNATDRVKPLGEAIGRWLRDTAIPAVQRLAGWIRDDLWPALKQVWELVSGAFATAWQTITDALAEAGISAQGTGQSLKDGIISALETLGPILATIITAVADLTAWFIRNRDIIIPIVAGIGAMVAAFMAAQKIIIIVKAATALLNVVMAANPIGLVVLAIVGLVAAFVTLWNRSDAFREFWINLWDRIKTAASAVADWFASIPQWFKDQFAKIRTTVSGFGDAWRKAWDLVKNLASTAWNAVRSLVQAGVDRVRSILTTIGNFIRSFLSSPLATMRNLFSNASATLRNIANQIWNGVSSAFSSGIQRAVQWVRDIPNRVRGAIGSPFNILANVGRQIIDGFINGISNGFQRVRNTLSNLTNMLPSWKGPASKDKKLLTGPADLIMDGLVDQFERRFGDVRGVLGDLTNMIGHTDLGDLDAPGLAPAGTYATRHAALAGGAGTGAGRTYEITVQTLVPTADTGRVIVNAIKDFERMNGARP